ncbi:hypothetical protein EON63_15855 [archaeon]|nr:MAG: hypothetical protein EON63_15855 [archaeon]
MLRCTLILCMDALRAGMKTEMEKFAGGMHTTTVEAYINGSGRAIQVCYITIHHTRSPYTMIRTSYAA